MDFDRIILIEKIESSLSKLGISFSLVEERSLPIFQDAPDLIVIETNSSGRPFYLIPEAGKAWFKLRDAANCDGVIITVVSAYRSFQRQFEIVKSKIKKGMPRGQDARRDPALDREGRPRVLRAEHGQPVRQHRVRGRAADPAAACGGHARGRSAGPAARAAARDQGRHPGVRQALPARALPERDCVFLREQSGGRTPA